MTDRSARTAARTQIALWRELESAPPTPEARKVLVVASYTANPLEAPVGVGLAEADGRTPVVQFADFNQIFQVCLSPADHGVDAAHDIIVLWRIEDVFERDFHAWSNLDPTAIDRLVEGAEALGRAVASLAGTQSAAITAADAPVPVGFGLDHHDPSAMTELMGLQQAMNAAFDDGLQRVLDSGTGVVERLRVAALQLAHGTQHAFDRRTWLMYRQPHAGPFTQLLGAAIVDSLVGRVRVQPKVLVLDCDDTLWAGVASNDGIGNLKCNDAFPGMAYREFQMAARRLRSRGVLLAIASKNDRSTVDEAFASVDGMVLTPADIAGWKVSWGPKPQAIAELANDFNLGIDSFVFVDDSDYEIGAVRSQLAEVVALQVPEDVEALPDLLAESGLFRSMRLTADDLERTTRIITELDRAAASTEMTHEQFLASLELHVRLTEAGVGDLARVTQLINKTNQFNLTTIRRDQAAVATLIARDDTAIFAVTVDDRFGEYGLVGVIIAVHSRADGWNLDTVLMSCRVLGRGVETAMLGGVITELRARRPGPITGEYVPTDRNALVADLLTRHGFAPDGDQFVLGANDTVAVPAHLTLTVLPSSG